MTHEVHDLIKPPTFTPRVKECLYTDHKARELSLTRPAIMDVYPVP
jgi:hypothetical protein